MKNLTLFLVILVIGFFASCAGDPCDQVICNNGACEDGTCLCEDGYKGIACDEIDLSGTFYMAKVQGDPMSNCTQAYLDYMPTLRGEVLCDNLRCSSLQYTFKSDFSFARVVIGYKDTDSQLTESFRVKTDGSYRIEGNKIEIIEGLDQGTIFEFDHNVLTVYEQWISNCYVTRTWHKIK